MEINILSDIITTQVILLSVIIALITQGIKKVLELTFTLFKKELNDKTKIWLMYMYKNLLLPIIPLTVGFLFVVFAKKYPIPDLFSHSFSSRAVLGICIGEVSSFIFMRFNNFFKAFAEVKAVNGAQDNTPDSPK